MIGVVVRFFADRYREGMLYQGLAGRPAVLEETVDTDGEGPA